MQSNCGKKHENELWTINENEKMKMKMKMLIAINGQKMVW